MTWKILSDTESPKGFKSMKALKDQSEVLCTERSVKIMIGVGTPVEKTKKTGNKGNDRKEN